MREVQGDAWKIPCDVLCITTNCTLQPKSKLGIGPLSNVMGGGIAGEAARRDPSLPIRYAQMIQAFGHHSYLMMLRDTRDSQDIFDVPVVMFPTKNEVWENSDLETIERSIMETEILANIYGWTDILLPRPGAGLGGLDWKTQVKPLCQLHLDDRFIIVSFPGEA